MKPIEFSRPFTLDEEADAAAATVRSGWLAAGPRLAEFERQFAAACGARTAVGVSSWTTGGFLVLHALGIGPGDEVIVPSLTFIASVNVIRHVGATPVFADVNPGTFNVDAADVARKVTPRTRAILPVDQLGLPCDIDALRAIADDHGLHLVEDAACAVGARTRGRVVGSTSPTTIFSLHARKVLTTGEGGMIVVDDDDFGDRLRRLRSQGVSASAYERHRADPLDFETYDEIGFNFRLTDVQAAIGLVQLDRLPDALARRKHIADRYTTALHQHALLVAPDVPGGLEPNWQSYMVLVRKDSPIDRDGFMRGLFQRGVPTRRGVMASHLEPPYARQAGQLPNTEHVAAHGFMLPIHPTLDPEQQALVLEALEEVSRGAAQ